MKVVRTVSRMRNLADRLRKAGKIIGFVPTMGALHEGHLSLIHAARKKSDIVVVSIFINPTQFGPTEDFHHYPRDPRGDRAKCRRAGVDFLFMPTTAEMYPQGHATYVSTERLTEVLCGPFRPGHFRGVTTVVTQLFNIVKPHIACFGQKDYQQSVVIRRMVKDLHLDVKVLVLPTVREPDGVAMSSRNAYLSSQERQAARILYQSLQAGREMILGGEKDPARIRSRLLAAIQKESSRIDYVSICHPETLQEVEKIVGKVLIALAAWFGQTRLIDNILVHPRG